MITPEQIRGARAMLGLTQAELAKKADLSTTALNNIERGTADPKVSTLRAIQAALESAGVIFVPSNGEGPGVRLRRSAETVTELTKQIDAIGAELAETDHNAPASPAKGMQQLEDAHKADKAVRLKNKRTKIEKK